MLMNLSVGRLAFPVVLLGLVTLLAPSQSAIAQDGEKPTLQSHMEATNKARRKLKKVIEKPESLAESLGLLSEMQANVVQAKGMEPTLTAEKPKEEQAKFVADYRKKAVELIAFLLEIEKDLLDGKHADAAAKLKKTEEMEEAAHKIFQKEKK
jgi:hypothetical protein